MFEVLFTRPYAIARHRNGPLAEQRRRYLADCAEHGTAIPTLWVLAHYLLTIAKYLKLGKRGNELISMAEVEAAAARWAGRRHRPPKMQTKFFAHRRFLCHARRWLQFMGRLEQPSVVPHAYADRIAAYAEFQREKGLSPQTIHDRGRVVQGFLDRLCESTHMKNVTPTQIDNVLQQRALAGNLKRVSIRRYAHCLRTFFQYAETRGWCRKGLAAAIMAPVVYSQENIPAGPSREDVQRLLATTEGDRPADIRDRALLLLLIIYGFRSGEVRRLQLEDLDWTGELIRVTRSKQRGRIQFFPLSRTVGDAILRYIKEVRPRTAHREVFLALNAPLRPLGCAAFTQAVASLLRPLGVSLRHYGPHSLRHACATHLLNQGHSMKEIGDYLGHSRPESTFVYAKVNLAGLRAVADFNLEGLP